MTNPLVQALTLVVAALVMLCLTIALTRRGQLSLRFGVGWLAVSCVVAIGAAVGAVDLVQPVARLLQLTPTGLIVAGVGGFLLLISLQLSAALSETERMLRTMAQEMALLEQRVLRVEAGTPAPAQVVR